jgi:hypothetical protein
MDFITVKCKWDFCSWQSKMLHVNHGKNEQFNSGNRIHVQIVHVKCIQFVIISNISTTTKTNGY